jgi:AraC-like DNA-binding protein
MRLLVNLHEDALRSYHGPGFHRLEPRGRAEVAVACGYFDQAHLIHDFQKLSGIRPSAYRPRSPERLSPPFTRRARPRRPRRATPRRIISVILST